MQPGTFELLILVFIFLGLQAWWIIPIVIKNNKLNNRGKDLREEIKQLEKLYKNKLVYYFCKLPIISETQISNEIKKFIPVCFLFLGTLALPQPSLAEEKIEVIPIIQSSKGLSGKNFNYLEGKPELRLLKVKIPVGLKTPIHTHPSPMLIHVTRGRLKHVRGEEINFFKAGDAFIESNNECPHYVKNVGKKPAILHVGVVSVVGMPTAINK